MSVSPTLVVAVVWIGVVVAFFTCVALLPLVVLHIYLRCKGMTTYEFIMADIKGE